MKKLISVLSALLLMLSAFPQIQAQTLNSNLVRNRLAVKYPYMLGSGTPFAYQYDYVRGSILYDKVLYEDVLLNLNSEMGEVSIKINPEYHPTVLETNLVEWFTLGDKRFENIGGTYYEVLSQGNAMTLYKKISKYYSEQIEGQQLKKNFTDINTFFVDSGEGMVQIKNAKAVYKNYPESRKEVKSALSMLKGKEEKMKTAAVIINGMTPEKEALTMPEGPFEKVRGALAAGPFAAVAVQGISTELPAGYFRPSATSSRSAVLDSLEKGATVASIQNKVYEFGTKEHKSGGKVTITGYVRDAKSSEPLAGVVVYDEKSGTYTSTDAYGFYKIVLPTGENVLNYNGYSLENVALDIAAWQGGNLDVNMKEKVYSLKGAVVSAESSGTRHTARMGTELVRINRIKTVPTAFGESDVLKVILTLPGVKTTGEASSGFNVRGGAADQNLILFNDGTVYNTSHLLGLFSAFNSDVIADAQLYKSSIPAEYGGRISSVLDIRSREGNANKVTGSAGIGILTSHAHIEGPIGKKTRFVLGGRTTYSDWLMKLLPEESNYSNGTASFYDINLGLTHQINSRNTLYAYGYYSHDKFGFGQDTSYKYRNLNASLKWRSNFNDHHNMVVSAGIDHYGYDSLDLGNPATAYQMSFGISQAFARLNFNYTINEKHALSYGAQGILFNVNSGTIIPYDNNSIVTNRNLDPEKAVEGAVFISDSWKINDVWAADLGVRLSGIYALKDNSFYLGPELRTSLKALVTDDLTWKIGFNSMRQHIQMLTNTNSISPVDTWKLCDGGIAPQTGWQGATGLYYNLKDGAIETSLELYYKQNRNALDFKSGTTLLMNDDIAQAVIPVKGRAYGAELMLKKPLGRLNGWVSYTYSRSQMRNLKDEGVYNINNGDWYNAPYDKPHEFKFVGNFKFTHRYSFSTNVDYSTGRPVTMPLAWYMINGGPAFYYSDRNAYRIPDYFRVDVAFIIEAGHYLKRLTHASFTVGVYNVTGRKNPYSVFYRPEHSQIRGYMLTVLGAPIPYLNFNLKF